jgi:hypothetical protein
MPFWFVIFKNLVLMPAMSLRQDRLLWGRIKALNDRKVIVFLLLFVFLLVSGAFRGVLNRAVPFPTFVGILFQMVTLFLFAAAVFLPVRSQRDLKAIERAVLYGVCLFVLVNVVLYAAGVANPNVAWAPGGQSRLLALLGIASPRVLFPLASGTNFFGVIAGASVIASVYLFFTSRSIVARAILVFLGGVSLFAILACDSRGALAFTFVVLGAFSLAPAFLRLRSEKWIVASPLIAPVILIVVTWLPPELTVDVLARTNSFDVRRAVTTGRTEIWASAINELSEPKVQHVFGYGHYGHVSSGIGREYASLFTPGSGAAMQGFTLHNGALQYLIDHGYVGFVLVIVMTVIALGFIRRCAGDARFSEPAAFSVLVFFFFFLGSAECVPTLYTPEAFLLFLLILGYAAFRPAPELVAEVTPATEPARTALARPSRGGLGPAGRTRPRIATVRTSNRAASVR